MSSVVAHNSYFAQRKDCTGSAGLTGYQKIIAALRMMVYVFCADKIDETLAISESTRMKSMTRFCRALVYCFRNEYLRSLTAMDCQEVLENANAWVS